MAIQTPLYDAFAEGIRARAANKPTSANPYDRKTQSNAWTAGWTTEDRWQSSKDQLSQRALKED